MYIIFRQFVSFKLHHSLYQKPHLFTLYRKLSLKAFKNIKKKYCLNAITKRVYTFMKTKRATVKKDDSPVYQMTRIQKTHERTQ